MTASSVAAARDSHEDVILVWWKRYCDPAAKTFAPGTRADLRRCRSALDAATVPAALDLARRVGALRSHTRPDDPQIDTALNLARVLAHVREHAPERPMRAAGWGTFPGDRKESEAGEARPVLSEARFRRLLQTSGREEQVAAFVRLVALLGDRVNVSAIGRDFLHWEDELTRRRWAFDYFAAGTAAPTEARTILPPTEDDA